MAGNSDTKQTLTILLFYFACIYFSIKYAESYTVVGPVFGLTVVAFDSKFFKNAVRDKHLIFVLASAFIYAGVFWLANRKWESNIAAINYFIGPFPIGVVFGSIALPFAHQYLFKKPIELIKRVIISLVASFYVIVFFSFLYNEYRIGMQFDVIGVSIAVWQGIYLYYFFNKSASKSKSR